MSFFLSFFFYYFFNSFHYFFRRTCSCSLCSTLVFFPIINLQQITKPQTHISSKATKPINPTTKPSSSKANLSLGPSSTRLDSKNSTGLTLSDLITTQSERWFGQLRVGGAKTQYHRFKSRFDYFRNQRTQPAWCLSLFQSQISCFGWKPVSLNSKLHRYDEILARSWEI